jgi:nucleotide-binding universal stress UspA family protein
MTWIIGVDLRPLSHGALQFASWIAMNAVASEGAPCFLPVHVLEEDRLLAVLRYHPLDELVAAAREAAQRTLEQHGRTEWLEHLQIFQALRPEERLEVARADAGADAIIIGRAAGRKERRVVRLGRVARRLLRALHSTVVVVPPDLQAHEIGGGPIVALTSTADDAVEAARFATALARHMGRKLALVHIVTDPADEGSPFMPRTALERARMDQVRNGERELAAWVASTGLRPDSTTVLQGNVIDEALAFADGRRSPLLVVGARRREGIDRALVPSIGRELAATAGVPVAVVPAAA